MSRHFTLKSACILVLQALALIAHAEETTPQVETVTVLGTGQSRQVQNITRNDMTKVAPGTSPLKTLDKLPGVSFQSADPFGAYEWSTRFSIRGFNQSQLGFTLDNVPLGDMSYGNNNGLHISRAISSENIGRVTLSQGAGSLSTASTSNLGGTVQFFSSDPTANFGFTGEQTIGSDNTSRTFARIDSGVLATGTKFYLSATRQRTNKTKGVGGQDQDQFNSKVVHDFGDNRISAFFNYSDRKEVDYQDMSLDMTRRLGYNWDNYAPDWQRAVNAANGIFTGGVNSLDDAYYMGSGLRKDSLAGATLRMKLSESADLKTTVYHHSNEGQGHWYTPYNASSPTMPISIRTTEYAISRDGLISDLNWDIGQHEISAGFWTERSNHTLTRNFYAASGPYDTNYFLSNPISTGFKQQFYTATTQMYLQDSMSMMDGAMKLNFGFKTPKVSIDATSLVGSRAAGSLTAKKTFLPQIGLNYNLSKNDELFASLSQNMRAYQPGVNGPFSQNQTSFNTSVTNIKPETSTTLDVGYRFKRNDIQGSVAIYHADFNDRLLNVANCPGIVGCPSTFVNVGKVATNGLEAVAIWSITPEFSWFNSFTYNDSKYKSNYLDGGIVAVEGKQVVDTPKVMFNTELSYETENWFTRVGGKFTDKRYYTYLNDAQVPSYWLSNLSVGYKQKSIGALKDVKIQFNVTNLLNKQYYSTIGSNGFATSDPNGTFATLLTGAPRQMFLSFSGKL
ncbi:TonB-dependent receptor [Undibacterium sp. TJN19]|uniref:TonB-dependent receptor n=1 Tax=Undibacterium sp. TJN19 TaxID=3413055 RepID=UPI003BF32DCC